MRKNPADAKKSVRELTKNKLYEVESRLNDLLILQKELTLLLNLCVGSNKGCPIIEEMDENNTRG